MSVERRGGGSQIKGWAGSDPERSQLVENTKRIESLERFWAEHFDESKGILSLALIITRWACKRSPPHASCQILAPTGDKLAGAGHKTAQAILGEYGITFTLPKISGSISLTRRRWIDAYLEWLNHSHGEGMLDLASIERWWIDRVEDHFNKVAFKLRPSPEKSLGHLFRELMGMAWTRSEGRQRLRLVSPLMEHLVGAKLQIAHPEMKIEHRRFVAAKTKGQRQESFRLGHTAIHVDPAPNEGLIKKCRDNLAEGLRPLILTSQDGIGGVNALSKLSDMDDKVEVMEIVQFLVANLYARNSFREADRMGQLHDLVNAYNLIVEQTETNPGLKIVLVCS